MTEFVNVLHLTDLHFGMEGDPGVAETATAQRQNALQPLIELLAGLERDWRPMVVAISGDIGWKGATADYALAGPFLAQLLVSLQLASDRVIACPGNHDLDRRATVGMLPPPSSKEADAWLQIENLANLARPFSAYKEFSAEAGIEPLSVGNASHRLIGQRDVLGLRFVVLNSAWFCRGDYDKGKLWIGLPQLQVMQSRAQLAAANLDEGPITVGLLHHPPHDLNEAETNAYGNRPATYRYLADRTHLLLSGHVHGAVERATRHHQGAFGIVGGASYAEGSYRNNFSILRIMPDNREVHRRAYEFDPRFERWDRLNDEETFSLGRRPPPPKATPFSVIPVPGLCWVYVGAEKYRENGRLSFRINVRLMSGQPVLVTSIFGLLYAEDGCPCLSGEATVQVNSKTISTMADHKTLVKAERCDRNGIVVTYWQEARPPLREQAPVDCEFGELELRVRILAGAEEKQLIYLFRFEPGGDLTPIDRRRNEPFLSDAALAALHKDLIIDSATLSNLLRLDPRRRYQLSTFVSQQQKELRSSHGETLEFIKLLEHVKQLEIDFGRRKSRNS